MYNAVGQRSQEAQQRARVLIILLVCSFLLQLAGFIAPGWIVGSAGESAMIHIGLWFYAVCLDGAGCEVQPTSDILWSGGGSVSDHMAGLTEYRAETCTALICCIVALVCAIRSRTVVSRVPTYGATAFFALIAGILSLVASGKVLDGILQRGKMYRLIGRTNPYDPPYALILTMVGGCLASITAIVGVYVYRSAHAQPQPQPQLQLQSAVQQQGQVLGMPQYSYASPMTPTDPTAVTNPMAPPAYPAYPGVNGGYVIEKAAPTIGQQANPTASVTY